MAADTKRVADKIWEIGNSKSKVFNAGTVIYFFEGVLEEDSDNFITLNISVKYKKFDLGDTSTVKFDAKVLSLTTQEKKCIVSLADNPDKRPLKELWKNAADSKKVEEKIKQYVIHLEKKDEAIALLQEYHDTRDAIKDDYKVLPCISEFFKGSSLESMLGIRRQDKLDAVGEVMRWLKESKTAKSTPKLNLTSEQIKALTNKTLGAQIEKVRKLDPEFDSAFKAAICRSKIPITSSLVINS